MGFEWDEEKEWRNVARHNLNFDAAMSILTGKGVERRSDRGGERRWAFTGEHDGKLWISARRARKNLSGEAGRSTAKTDEERDYHNTFA